MTTIKPDPFTSYTDVVCRDGIERRVYPAKLKYKDKLRDLTTKFNDTYIIGNLFSFDADGKQNTEAWDSMMEVLELAFDGKYTKDEIEDFLDLGLARKVFEIFYDISSLKKNNQTEITE